MAPAKLCSAGQGEGPGLGGRPLPCKSGIVGIYEDPNIGFRVSWEYSRTFIQPLLLLIVTVTGWGGPPKGWRGLTFHTPGESNFVSLDNYGCRDLGCRVSVLCRGLGV